MGTPDFAVASLDAMIKAGFDIVGVVTAPDKPSGRGQKIAESAVKKYATEHNLKVLQPVKLKDPGFISELRALKADLQIVVAFRMLPEIVWNMPPKGTINLHASLLPQYRGAAPINWAILNGDKESGVTTFFLQHEIDTGNILFKEKIDIQEDMTAGELHDKLMFVGAELLVKTIKAVESGDYVEKPQDQFAAETLVHAPKIFKEDCEIDWNSNTKQVYNLIRGMSPYPTAFTSLNGKGLKIFAAEKQEKSVGIKAGEFITDNKTYLKFATSDGLISIKELQLEGKKRMKIDEFLRGTKL
ncbi:methionyl-tRNA formyltransferase [Pseudopedobacter saltans DSM 12145]|uniref:Methionyl-tRNA formyltransferase n=2 Tax=Pseudopedobacter saltans TaxID=151895 RepID=F0SB32_PSESL|nr:methionyl-tRNA formyltransferase [Pseudopedobacter saltans DSM 12145]